MVDISFRDVISIHNISRMMNMNIVDLKKRLNEIEDRKIEILTETGRVNTKYKSEIERLNSEYRELDEEYYFLRMKMMGVKNRISKDSYNRPRACK